MALRQIVQDMYDAKEDQEDIIYVIEAYNLNGNVTVLPEDEVELQDEVEVDETKEREPIDFLALDKKNDKILYDTTPQHLSGWCSVPDPVLLSSF